MGVDVAPDAAMPAEMPESCLLRGCYIDSDAPVVSTAE